MIDDIHHTSPYMNFHGFHNVLMLTSWIGWIRSGKVISIIEADLQCCKGPEHFAMRLLAN